MNTEKRTVEECSWEIVDFSDRHMTDEYVTLKLI
jgi:hypothetical protein